jgi:SpoVK/Ycf46/Vps4 family AAA+-type ATPase
VRETFRTIKHRSGRVVTSHITKREFEHLVQTLRGLTLDEAGRVVAAAIYADGSLTNSDLPRIIEHKRQRLHTSGCLESILVDVEVDELGGLENLKRWLALRRQGFTSEARAFGLSPPRGMLLLGVQGCGKSLCAKMVASDWGMPLLRLDPGTLYNRFVGESENRLRQALSQAEAIAPAVLWIDEIEKAFAFASADSADGGLSQRMFGTLLTWMQDHRAPLFIVATANDIAKLPPELMRKGRFDEVFFVDLPRPDNRAKILATHLRRRQRDPQTLNLEPVVAATEGFSGAELEQLILAGLFEAYQAQSELTADILVDVAQQTQPLAILMRERVNELRRWAAERCVPADKIS